MFVEYGLGFGGAVISLSELVESLYQFGEVDPIVLTFQRPEITLGLFPHAKVIHLRRVLSYLTRDAFVKFVDRTPLLSPMRALWIKLYAGLDIMYEMLLSIRVYQVARREHVDFVHMNNGWEISAARAARWAGARVVVHARGFGKTENRTPPDRAGRVVRPKDSAQPWYVCISNSVAESVRASGVPPERILTIYNPVSLERHERDEAKRDGIRARWGISSERVVVAVFGRVVPWKGQLEFLEAVAGIADACQDLIVAIVGDASDSDGVYLGRVRELADAPSLAGRVVFTGYQHEVAGYFAASDIVVHCSLQPEPFGRVVIEGMASGKPVVAMDEGGPREIITDGENGLLVKPRDPAALQEALLKLHTDPALRARLGAQARLTVERRFAPRVISAQVAQCYRR